MNHLKLTFCNITPGDLPEILSIAEQCGHSGWSESGYEDEIARPDNISIAAKDGVKTVGFIIARLIIFKNLHIHITDSAKCIDGDDEQWRIKEATNERVTNARVTECEIEIYNIAVRQAFQRQGIGDALLNKLFEEVGKTLNCRKLTAWLEVRAANERAIGFYAARNFKEVYRRKNYYSEPTENAVIMKREVAK